MLIAVAVLMQGVGVILPFFATSGRGLTDLLCFGSSLILIAFVIFLVGLVLVFVDRNAYGRAHRASVGLGSGLVVLGLVFAVMAGLVGASVSTLRGSAAIAVALTLILLSVMLSIFGYILLACGVYSMFRHLASGNDLLLLRIGLLLFVVMWIAQYGALWALWMGFLPLAGNGVFAAALFFVWSGIPRQPRPGLGPEPVPAPSQGEYVILSAPPGARVVTAADGTAMVVMGGQQYPQTAASPPPAASLPRCMRCGGMVAYNPAAGRYACTTCGAVAG